MDALLERPAVPSGAAVELAQRLVAAGDAEAPWDTREACRVLEEELGSDFSLEALEPEPGCRSLIARYRFERPGPALVLCGHVDVVPAGPPEAWTVPPFAGVVRDGRLYGRGACDMKGAVAALVVAARAVVSQRLPLAGRLVLALVADEETGGRRGAGAFVASGVRADGVLVAEPSDGAVCTSHRGICFVEVVTLGRAGHASRPDRAESAVELMVDVLASLRALRLTFDPEATSMTPGFALGTTIGGGTGPNMVADRCRATLDVRKVTGMTDESVLADLWAHLRAGGIDASRVRLSVQGSGEPAECAAEERIVVVARDAYERETGVVAPVDQFPAATDGFWFANHARAATVMAFGPGSLDGCHVLDECVEVAELEGFARIYADCAASFLSPSD